MLVAQLTGRLLVTDNGISCVPTNRRRARSILAYLLVNEGEPVTRDELAGNLWPDQSNQQARTNLRREILSLRNQSPVWDAHIKSDKQTLSLEFEDTASVDLRDFYNSKKLFDDASSIDERCRYGTQAFESLHGELLVDIADLSLRIRSKRQYESRKNY